MRGKKRKYLNIFLLLVGLYFFVCSLSGFKESWELAFAAEGKENFARNILQDVVRNPFTALIAGVLATSLIQSSSATIAIAIATVASGGLTIMQVVPLIMGANIGTTITNTIVSLAYAFRRREFVNVIPAAIVDDIFKIMNVFIFFIIELTTGFLSKTATFLAQFLGAAPIVGNFLKMFPDFVDVFTEPVLEPLIASIVGVFGKSLIAAVLLGFLSFVGLIFGLRLLANSVRKIIQPRTKDIVGKAFKSPLRGTIVGFGLCWILQSSSVTTSLIMPFAATALIKLKQVYHYALGAAIGTTCDAGQIISYIKFGVLGLNVGLVHVLLNVFGVLLFSVVPFLKGLPIRIASKIGELITRSRFSAILLIIYTVTIFYIIPFLVLVFWR